MASAATFVITMTIIFSVVFTIARDSLETYDIVTNAWTSLEARAQDQTATRIAGPTSLRVPIASTVEITIANQGSVPLEEFSRWDVVFEVQQDPGVSILYLDYTDNPSPGANQWTIKAIYLDASNQTPEVVDPGVLDPGEEMVVLANPSPAVRGGTYNRATFATPNGVVASVIFAVPVTFYVVDNTDDLVYEYWNDGTLVGTHSLDAQNADVRGITHKDTSFWTTDWTDDTVYRYTTQFSLSSSWAQNLLNNQGVGITTNGTNIWIVDENALKVFKYDMDGNLAPDVSQFALNVDNLNPTGIATNGTHIWVVDGADAKVYRYDTLGVLVSSFNLDAANTDPTGITTDGSHIWVVDRGGRKAFAYDMNGGRVTSSDLALDSANADAQGITVRPR